MELAGALCVWQFIGIPVSAVIGFRISAVIGVPVSALFRVSVSAVIGVPVSAVIGFPNSVVIGFLFRQFSGSCFGCYRGSRLTNHMPWICCLLVARQYGLSCVDGNGFSEAKSTAPRVGSAPRLVRASMAAFMAFVYSLLLVIFACSHA